MKESIFTLMEQAIVENNIDLNSPYTLERKFLFDKICDKIDFTQLNKFQSERKLKTISKMVTMKFEEKKLTSISQKEWNELV